ncbi:MAG: M48 family metallopeptidase [Kiritimatiellae bacterium]|nr:M48 family metallopeptidase [Kiritimatiellia bacterium]
MTRPSIIRLLPVLPLATSAIMLSCATVPITGRRQFSIVSDKEVLSSSLTEYRSYMGKAKVSGDKTRSAQVVRVGRRIANATEAYLRGNGLGGEVANFSWEFNLVQDAEVNAFCMPGGKIVVYTGLMELVASDDELAVVLGHEVAHAVAKHSNERMSQQMAAALGTAAATEVVGRVDASKRDIAATVFGLGAQVGVMLPFSRTHESEADYMGLALMTMAGYDPGAAVGFWRKMAAKGGSSTPAILSSHPSDARRISDIQKALPEIRAKYGAKK